MKNLVFFGLKDGRPNTLGVVIKDKEWSGGAKVVDIYGSACAISELTVESRLKGWARVKWHIDAIQNDGATVWTCICLDVESYWYFLTMYRKIKRNYKRLQS